MSSNQQHRAGRIPIHPEAFSNDLRSRGKHPRQQMREHLAFIRSLPCLVCGTRTGTIQAAHIRAGNPAYAKRTTGAGEKPSDQWAVPLCARHHAEQHDGYELTFWHLARIDPFRTALALFAASGDEEAAELIIREARR